MAMISVVSVVVGSPVVLCTAASSSNESCLASSLVTMATDFDGIALTSNGSLFSDWTHAMTTSRQDYEQVNTRMLRYVVFILYLVTFCIGAVGNTVTIVAIAANQRLKRSVATCFMLNLAVADDLFILSLPFMAHSTLTRSWAFGAGMCKLLSVLHGVNCYASIFTMTAMSVDRYLAVVRPLSSLQYRTPRHAAAVCIATWAVCSIIMLPYWLYADVGLDGASGYLKCKLRWPDATKFGHQWFWNVFEFVVGFAGPVIVMGVGYARLLRGLIYATRTVNELDTHSEGGERILATHSAAAAAGAAPGHRAETGAAEARSTKSRSSASTRHPGSATSGLHGDRARRQIRRVTAMVFAVTAAFVVCWTPYHIERFMSLYKQWSFSYRGIRPSQSDYMVFAVLNTVAQALIFASSCCNPFIYCISSSNFIARCSMAAPRSAALNTSLPRLPTSSRSLPQAFRVTNGSTSAVDGRRKDCWIKLTDFKSAV